jgi:hypothetical protein
MVLGGGRLGSAEFGFYGAPIAVHSFNCPTDEPGSPQKHLWNRRPFLNSTVPLDPCEHGICSYTLQVGCRCAAGRGDYGRRGGVRFARYTGKPILPLGISGFDRYC